VKQRVLELINQPMALATCPHTVLILPPNNSFLDNSRTLAECGIPTNARLSLSFLQQDIPAAGPQHPAAIPSGPLASSQPEFSRIQQIWSSPNTAPTQRSLVNTTLTTHALLPSELFDDEDDLSCSSCSTSSPGSSGSGSWGSISPSHDHFEQHAIRTVSRDNQGRRNRGGRRSHSPPLDRELNPEQLRDLAANFRTKMCRNGRSCKFGRNCWFAHNGEELRKPSDPLPNNLPAVHKLERYSHREGQDKTH